MKTKKTMQQASETDAGRGDVLVDQVIAALNAEAKKATRGWLVMGQLVKDYIERSNKATGDAFLRLSAHPDCPLGATSLRSYYAAYLLWLDIGRNAIPPEVDYTKFTIVASSAGVNYGDKLRLLRRAELEKWSVTELKRQIALLRQGGNAHDPDAEPEEGQGGTPGKQKPAVDWSFGCRTLEKQTGRLVDDLTFLFSLQPKGDIPKGLRANVRHVVRLLLMHHLIEREFIMDNMPSDTGDAA